jgi:hypothetical protein
MHIFLKGEYIKPSIKMMHIVIVGCGIHVSAA